MKPENKFALAVYLWGAIAGIVSGALSVQNRAAWVLGTLMFLITDVFMKIILKDDLPEELRNLGDKEFKGAVLRKAFWGWFLFWLYFTMLVYTVGIDFKPIPYNNQSLLAQMMNAS